MNWKEWYIRNGIGLLILGAVILAISFIVAYVYETITEINIRSVPNHPLAFVCLFGMLLIVIGACSVPLMIKHYQ